MPPDDRKLIAVFGATGHQGGGVVRALRAAGKFKIRAITRDPAKHPGIADEVVEADLDRPASLRAALEGAYGVFLVTNFWEPDTNEEKQARSAVEAAKVAGVQHFVWSTLPDVEAISGGKLHVPHFTGKARVDKIVRDAGFKYHTFVIAPFYFQNLAGVLAPQKQPDQSLGWALPIDPNARGIHMGDIDELGKVAAGAFEHPEVVGRGEYLPLSGDVMSFNDIIGTLNGQGHRLTFRRIPVAGFLGLFRGAAELAATFAWIQMHTYLGGDSRERIALANVIAGSPATRFATWARVHFPAHP